MVVGRGSETQLRVGENYLATSTNPKTEIYHNLYDNTGTDTNRSYIHENHKYHTI